MGFKHMGFKPIGRETPSQCGEQIMMKAQQWRALHVIEAQLRTSLCVLASCFLQKLNIFDPNDTFFFQSIQKANISKQLMQFSFNQVQFLWFTSFRSSVKAFLSSIKALTWLKHSSGPHYVFQHHVSYKNPIFSTQLIHFSFNQYKKQVFPNN